MPPTFTIFCNARLTEPALAQLRAGVAPHRLIMGAQPTRNLLGGAVDPLLKDAQIAFGQPNVAQSIEQTSLKWIHLTTAGYNRYDIPSFWTALRQRAGILTNSSSVYDEPCAEHALALILSAARRLRDTLPGQWPYEPMRSQSRLLVGQTALLVGFGAIGRRLAELLSPLRMNLIGIRRTPRGSELIPVSPISDLDTLLPLADHVVNMLPASDNTNLYFNAPRFARMKPGAIFYNIGRGGTVDQPALRQALDSAHLAAAYIDVTTPEPLPPDDPLWSARNLHITPHTAGGFDAEFPTLVRHFLNNLGRYELGQPLADQVTPPTPPSDR